MDKHFFLTFCIAYWLGYVAAQKAIIEANSSQEFDRLLKTEDSPEKTKINTAHKIKVADNTSPDHTASYLKTDVDLSIKLDQLLSELEQNPNQASSDLKLYALLETLSVDELITLGESLKDRSETQRNLLSQLIIGQLLEKSPEQALAFALQHNPMPGSPYFIASIKAEIAQKNPELGFQYLNEILDAPIEGIDLMNADSLMRTLAKTNLNQLVSALTKYKERGGELKHSLAGLSFDLKTSDEFLNLFNELRRLDDMSTLSSVMISWIKISPSAVFERLNEIEDTAERQRLTDSAFHFWMLDKPEVAAEHHLANASNKVIALKNILRIWPDKQASQALNWISTQSDVDVNRYKVEYLKDLSRSNPAFVRDNLDQVSLKGGEKIDFYKSVYDGFKRKSSADAEAFLNTLPFKEEVLGNDSSTAPTKTNRVANINKQFRRYFLFKFEKAFALALGDNGDFSYAYEVNKASQSEANELALSRCEARRYKRNISNQCKIYAEGDVTLFSLTP